MAQITRSTSDGTGGTSTLRLIENMDEMADTNAGMPTVSPDLALPAQAALEMVKVGSTIAGFWLQHGTEQLTRSSQLLRQAAAAGSWQERLELQNAFLRDGVTRLNERMSRYADEVQSIVDCSRTARAEGPSAPC